MPAHWRYDHAKAGLDAAGRLIDVSLAERRNLVMRNPIAGNRFVTSRTLVCAYQMILPGEKAPSHRHTAHALRVIIDAQGRLFDRRWREDADGNRRCRADARLVLARARPRRRRAGLLVRRARRAAGRSCSSRCSSRTIRPLEEIPRVVTTSPYRFSRDDIARRLDKANADNEGFHGPRIVLDAPTMPTMVLTVERLPPGAMTRRQRSTTNCIFCVMEGSGETIVGKERFAWQRGDTFVRRPGPIEHHATSDAQLFACPTSR